MTQYIDKAAVVAEIKRYKHKADERLKIKGRTLAEDLKDSALQNLCGNLIYFLDTLEVKEMEEEPVSKDLEEAAHLYVDTTIEYFDSEGNPCCYSAFKAGAQWQKEQMVKGVDLEGISKNYALNNSPWDDCMLEMQNAFKDGFELGLKVQKGEE